MAKTSTGKGISNKRSPMALALTVFAVFLCVQAVAVFSLTMFGDDYYYADFMQSREYFVSENIRHFKEVNGRVLVHLFAQLLLADRSLTVFALLDIAAIGATVLYAALIGAGCFGRGGDRRLPVAIVLSCFLFSALPIEMLRSTAYWLTGSVNYLFPMALLVAFTFYVLRALRLGTVGTLGSVLFPLFAFLGAYSTEQASAGMLAVCAYAAVMALIDKRKEKSENKSTVRIFFISLAMAVVGFSALMLAPGNSARLKYYPEFFEKSLFSRISCNIPILLNYNIGKTGSTLLTVLFLVLLPLYLKKRAEEAECKKTSRFLAAFSPFSVVFAVFYLSVGSFFAENEIMWTVAALLVGTGIAVCFICCIPLLIKERSMLPPAFILLAAALQAAMLFSPEIGARTCLCSAVLLFVPILEAGSSLAEDISAKKTGRRVTAFICCVITAACMAFSGVTAYKYAENSFSYSVTEDKIAEYKKVGGTSVTFMVPPNDKYRYILPYDNEYHEYWFKKCYSLPEDVKIEYSQLN